jgi:nucleoid-associated protein YejK
LIVWVFLQLACRVHPGRGLRPFRLIPPDKKTLNKFRRFIGRADGLSISFEQHLLGSKVEFDEAGGTLTLRGLSRQLTDQLTYPPSPIATDISVQ